MGLGDLPGGAFRSEAYGASADGSVIVGRGTTDNGDEAFIWTEDSGMERFLDVLVLNGAIGLTDWILREATAISADGQWVVGYGINPLGHTEAFLANIAPVPVPAAVWLFGSALGSSGTAAAEASHRRSLNSRPVAER